MTIAAPRVFRFTCELPPRSLHPNARPSWQQKARDARDYRLFVGLGIAGTLYRQPWPRWYRARIDLEYVFPSRRRHDPDGLWSWAKQLIDAIVDARILPDDDAEHLSLGALTMRVRAAGEQPGGCVCVTLEEIE